MLFGRNIGTAPNFRAVSLDHRSLMIAGLNGRIPVNPASSSARLPCLQKNLGSNSCQRICLVATYAVAVYGYTQSSTCMYSACMDTLFVKIRAYPLSRSWSTTVQSQVEKPEIRHDQRLLEQKVFFRLTNVRVDKFLERVLYILKECLTYIIFPLADGQPIPGLENTKLSLRGCVWTFFRARCEGIFHTE